MRIAIVGSAGVGKTTLVNQLQDLGLPILSESALEVIHDWRDKDQDFLPWNVSKDKINAFQQEILLRQIEKEKSKGYFITDRSGFDCLAYSQECSSYSYLTGLFMNHNYKHPYDLIIRIPIAFELKAEGQRLANIEYQKKIDRAIIQELEKHNQKFITIPGKTTTEERIEFVKNCL